MTPPIGCKDVVSPSGQHSLICGPGPFFQQAADISNTSLAILGIGCVVLLSGIALAWYLIDKGYLSDEGCCKSRSSATTEKTRLLASDRI